jgi:IS1 family transposase
MMETTMMILIKQLEQIESHMVTTDNVILYAKSLLMNERDQMIDIGNRYHTACKERGIVTITGQDLVDQLYGKLANVS